MPWEALDTDTDCRGCFYTIRVEDPDGMFRVGEDFFCSEPCHQSWAEDVAEEELDA